MQAILDNIRKGEKAHQVKDIITASQYYRKAAEQFQPLATSLNHQTYKETCVEWVEHLLRTNKSFLAVTKKYAAMSNSQSDPNQIASYQIVLNVFLNKLSPQDAALISYRPPSPKLQFDLAELVVHCADLSFQRNDSATSFHLYVEAVSLYQDCLKVPQNPQVVTHSNQKMKYCLDRAEAIKRTGSIEPSVVRPHFSREEQQVLISSSSFHSLTFEPWVDQDVVDSQFIPADRQLFTDPYVLPLASSQKKHSPVWLRPREIVAYQAQDMAIFGEMNPATIHQTVVGDCSFLSSLSGIALLERRTGKKYLSNLIYPQNRQGVSVYNPIGRYFVRLYFNGCWRRVIIDDKLPCSSSSTRSPLTIATPRSLLCSYSTNRNELWVSLLEKAFLKVHGSGYAFPGSMSEVDLYFLCGFIPEKWDLRTDSSSVDQKWRKLKDGVELNLCIVTISTGEMSAAQEESVGLVSGHAYSLLGCKEMRDGTRLLQLKNPWGHKRWKGRFSETDITNWTPARQREMGYSPQAAQKIDDGIFWIDLDSLLQYFGVCHFSWAPELFPTRSTLHLSWNHLDFGQSREERNFRCPQLQFFKRKDQTIWVLAHRHYQSSEVTQTVKGLRKMTVEEHQEDEDEGDDGIAFALRITGHIPVKGKDGRIVPPSAPRLPFFVSSQSVIVHTCSHFQLQKITSPFEGYFTLGLSLLSPLPPINKPLAFSIHFFSSSTLPSSSAASSTPIPIQSLPLFGESTVTADDSWGRNPFLSEITLREGRRMDEKKKAGAAGPSGRFVKRKSEGVVFSPVSTTPLPRSLLQFFHASNSFFAPQFTATFSPSPTFPPSSLAAESLASTSSSSVTIEGEKCYTYSTSPTSFSFVTQSTSSLPFILASSSPLSSSPPKDKTKESIFQRRKTRLPSSFSNASVGFDYSTYSVQKERSGSSMAGESFSEHVVVTPSPYDSKQAANMRISAIPPNGYMVTMSTLPNPWSSMKYVVPFSFTLSSSTSLPFLFTSLGSTAFHIQFICISSTSADCDTSFSVSSCPLSTAPASPTSLISSVSADLPPSFTLHSRSTSHTSTSMSLPTSYSGTHSTFLPTASSLSFTSRGVSFPYSGGQVMNGQLYAVSVKGTVGVQVLGWFWSYTCGVEIIEAE
ncbi:putative Calpain-type cysteine protease DEK1 [Blattamonas nauphoetae]|uniref:Calpain-type cysteine protease DEK1 n=1 Tax=Blattamonas nauphoetae TaxID=2049346 RepID=A0ABQ9XX26_9EUKA|nr:putative Calpain-type cysteine protease DEK1 [Blattamonas nauphoetae]